MTNSGYKPDTWGAWGLEPFEYHPVYSWLDISHPKPPLPRVLMEGWHECLAILRKSNCGLLRGIRRGVVRIDEPAEKIPEVDDSWII